eukprot:GHRR01026620.1.p1 GENE.GHRR01026620.1~~GHRR01026620.1.p1  ORF type:complete len:130 (-),score=13.68 GHRR01026620.1:453-842(-)
MARKSTYLPMSNYQADSPFLTHNPLCDCCPAWLITRDYTMEQPQRSLHLSAAQKYTNEEAKLRLLKNGKEVSVLVHLQAPVKLIPFHIKGKPPSYFIVAGLVFTPATVPYLRSEYGKEYDFDAPVSLKS